MERKASLVDGAEQALRNWLAPGRHRRGDRLPPEHDLAAMLGISRGTLRTALRRLEQSGEIIRRQGSGTFVAEVVAPRAFSEGLESLTSYSQLARRRGAKLTQREIKIERRAVGPELGSVFRVAPSTPALTVSRVVALDDEPVAMMLDTVHPDLTLPSDDRLRRLLERGRMVLDVLLELGVPIAFSNTRIDALLIGPDDPRGRALGVEQTTAALELEETMHIRTGKAVQRSTDLFAPGGLDLHVMRYLEAKRPTPVGAQV